MSGNDCTACDHYIPPYEEIGPAHLPGVDDVPAECLKHPGWSNLTTFPFTNTKCADFKALGDTSHE